MKLGTVIGTVVASRKESNVDSLKILVVQFLDAELQGTAVSAACIDTVNAGPGDIVICCGSSSARTPKATRNACIDHSIIGIVDSVSAGKTELYKRSSGIGGHQ
jgi:microcompartment protein CcmK/EutM